MNQYLRIDQQTLQTIRGTTMLTAEAAKQLASKLGGGCSRDDLIRAAELTNRITAQLHSFDNLRQTLTEDARQHMKAIERDFGPPEQHLKDALEHLRDAMDRAERDMLDARPLPPVDL